MLKASGANPGIVDDGAAESANPHKTGPPLDIQRKDAPQLVEQELDVVPPSLLAESAEVAKVLPYLRGRH